MKKYSLKKHVAILLAALMAINTNISAFAQNNYDSTAIQSENAPSGSVIITTLIISKKPRNTGKLRDRDTEFTTDLLHSDRALTRCSFP